ncbi:MAG: M56 family metallopeptidase [Planctomycetota bacterium]
MSLLELIGGVPALRVLGWTLLHFVWQGALVAALLWTGLRLLRGRSANARYATCCAGMIVMLLAPLATLALAPQSPVAPLAAVGGRFALLELESLVVGERLSVCLPGMALAWVAGVGVLQGRLVILWVRARQMKHHGIRRAPVWLRQYGGELARRLGISRAVCILQSGLALVPTVVGWLRPVILVPASAMTGLTPTQLRAVIAHELAHVCRHDFAVNLLQAIFETLLFYHPAVWWLSRRLRVEREYCCDDLAVKACGNALVYARALSELAELHAGDVRLGLASTGGSLLDRIARIAGVSSVAARGPSGWWLSLVTLVLVVLAVMALSAPLVPATSTLEARDVSPLTQVEEDQLLIKPVMPWQETYAAHKKKLIAELEAEGRSQDEIGLALYRLRDKAKAQEEKARKRAVRDREFVEKMRAAGCSTEMIGKLLFKLHRQDEATEEEARRWETYEA